MNPTTATCRPAPPSRAPALPLIELFRRDDAGQPTLPWTGVPETVAADTPLDPALRHLAGSLMSAFVEVLAGQRSSLQLELWAEPDLLSLLDHLRRARRGEGVRLRSVRVQAPHDAALEVTAHLVQNGASRAAALRISRRRGRWVATQLVIALRPGVVHRAGWVNPLDPRTPD
jgi:hypothetical protein